MTKRYLKTPEEVVQALKAGKEVFSFVADFKYKMIDGVICRYSGTRWILNSCLDGMEKLYVDEPEPLKLEVGKFYKTRGGQRAIVLGIEKNNKDGFPLHVALMDAYSASFYVTTSGQYNSSGSKDNNDLVAPWEE